MHGKFRPWRNWKTLQQRIQLHFKLSLRIRVLGLNVLRIFLLVWRSISISKLRKAHFGRDRIYIESKNHVFSDRPVFLQKALRSWRTPWPEELARIDDVRHSTYSRVTPLIISHCCRSFPACASLRSPCSSVASSPFRNSYWSRQIGCRSLKCISFSVFLICLYCLLIV